MISQCCGRPAMYVYDEKVSSNNVESREFYLCSECLKECKVKEAQDE